MDVREILKTRSLPCLVVHGGAGMRPGAAVEPILEGIRHATRVGYAVLEKGGSALDAVEAAVVVLEENVHFNAGRGSALTSDGTVELDASIMEGAQLRAGAVASVSRVRNPVRFARVVMEKSDHILLVGAGAERYAEDQHVDLMSPAWFVTPEQHARFEELKRDAGARPDRSKLGTVGCVAVDVRGHVAAATSTGGTAFKRPGRVGDSPIIGCGTWADDASGAVSCTGHGESIIRLTLARWTADRIAAGLTPLEAAELAAQTLKARLSGDGGLIVMGADGRAGWATNTHAMSRGIMRGGMSEPFASM